MKIILLLHIIILTCLNLYVKAQHAEKVLTRTDKNVVQAGEVLWFAIDVMDACSNRKSEISRVAYVELLNADGQSITNGKIGLEKAHGEGSFQLNDQTPAGIYTLRAYTNWMKNFGPSTYSHSRIRIENALQPAAMMIRQASAASSAPPTAMHKTREKVTIDLSEYVKELDDVTISVVNEDANDNINSPVNYQSPCGRDVAIHYPPEMHGHLLTARIFNKATMQPASGIRGYLSIKDKHHKFYVATSDSAGRLFFELDNVFADNEITLQTNPLVDSIYSIYPENPFDSSRIPQIVDSGAAAQGELKDNLNPASISAQVQTLYHLDKLEKFEQTIVDTTPFYGVADDAYRIKDFVRFSTVEDILREYVTTVGVKRKGGEPIPFVTNMVTSLPFDEPPMLMINGEPVFRISRLMTAESDSIETMSVVTRHFFSGYDLYSGIMDVRMKGNVPNLERNAVIVDYAGLQLRRTFYSPSYETNEHVKSRMPDFRNVLYWNDQVDPNKPVIEFYTSDMVGRYTALIQGISSNGSIETKMLTIEVK